jgi:electron-transferring-flavoprotein dehydrogenase
MRCPAALWSPAPFIPCCRTAGGRTLQIDAADRVHRKGCDIKGLCGLITWVTPEGSAGPNYASV